ncbi:MAG TPA: DUF2142 domain-containing protein [Acidimicrobiales bacterium]
MLGLVAATERRTWWWVFGLVFVAAAAWALATPPMTGPDESANAIRAAAVVRGQITGRHIPDLGGNELWSNVMVEVDVPASFAEAGYVGACYLGEPRERIEGAVVVPRGADCPELTSDTRSVDALTYEYRGQPFFYALVGLPTLVSVDDAGAVAMRLVGALPTAALLASAVLSVRRLPTVARALTGLGAAVTVSPELVYLAGMQNAGSVEIAAALAAWTSGLAMVTLPEAPDGRLVNRTAVALVVLILTRGLSPAFAALLLLVLVALARPGRVRSLLARPEVRAWMTFGVGATAVSGVWLWVIHEQFPLYGFSPIGFADALARVPWWVQGMVAVFGSTDVVPPVALHWAWGAAAALVVGLSAVAGSRRHLLVALGLIVAGIGLLISGEGFGVPQTGFWWQGRYVLPLVAGALVVAPTGVREPSPAAPAPGRLRWAAAAVLAVFVAGHAWSFAYALRHYTVGHDGPWSPSEFLLDPIWSPPLPPVLLLPVFVAAVAGLAAVLWRVTVAPAVTGAVDGGADDRGDGAEADRDGGDAGTGATGRPGGGTGNRSTRSSTVAVT